MSWRFYPLAEATDAGVLAGPNRNPRPAVFLTPGQAKALQVRKERAS